MKRLLTLLLLFTIPIFCRSQGALKFNRDTVLNLYTVKDLQDDFQFFRKAMETIHPSLYRYHPKDSVNKWLEEGFAQIDRPMNDEEFIDKIAIILAKLGSGHTQITPRPEARYAINFKDRYMLPFSIYIHKNRLFVKNCTNRRDTTFKTGDEVLAINNELSSAILTEARNHVTGDGFSNNFKDFKIEGAFGSIYKTEHPNQYQFFITYRSGESVKRKLVKAADLMKPGGNYFGDIVQFREATGSAHKVFYPYDIPSTAILKLRDFTYKNNYIAFHKEFFKTLHDAKINNLVIDLRDNTGGLDNIAIDLMKYLAPKNFHFSLLSEWYVTINRFEQLQKLADAQDPINLSLIDHFLTRDRFGYNMLQYPYSKDVFTGKIFILVNKGTFSAATLFATAMKNQVPCVIIGEETGGGIAGCDGGILADINLPHTQASLHMPVMFCYAFSKEHDYGQGLKPDIEFYPTPAEIYDQVYKELDPIIPFLKTNVITNK